MSIEIKCTKVIEAGRCKIRIDKIKALSLNRLPDEYLRGLHCYMNTTPVFKKNYLMVDYADKSPIKELAEGDIVEVDYFYKTLKLIRKCGKRLMKINKKIRKRSKSWKDGETEKIKI